MLRSNKKSQQSQVTENPTPTNEPQSVDNRTKRARSRSPPAKETKYIAPKDPAESKPKPKDLIENSAEWQAEHKAERKRKCLPEIRDKHLTVCSSTLWLGHVPKTVTEADISDAFGEYGTITSIDLIPPRGCAYVCMDRRQDAKKALSGSRDLKLNGSHVKMAWAPGKGFKEYKKLKDFWEVDVGSSFIPYNKIDASIDFEVLEEGGVIDEDSMSMEMREMRERKAKEKEDKLKGVQPGLSLPLPTLPILTQPPPFAMPPPNLSIPPPTVLSQGASLGGIPFPPPIVTSSSNQIPPNIFDHQELQEDNNNEALQSPTTLDQQLSITERQINMVEQQLNMIQQAQNRNQPQPSMPSMHPQAMFHPQSQPNPMLFDLNQQQLLHGGPPMMDPHQPSIPIFANPPPILSQPPSQLLPIPISQAGMNPNLNGNSMPHYGGRY